MQKVINSFKTFYIVFNNVPPKPHEFCTSPVQANIVDLDLIYGLIDQLESWANTINTTDYLSWSEHMTNKNWLSVCDEEDLKSSTFSDLDYSSVKELSDVNMQHTDIDKTYYINSLFGWLDNKFSFLKQDFGEMFPNSVYAMQDLNALRPEDNNLTVMMNNSAEVSVTSTTDSNFTWLCYFTNLFYHHHHEVFQSIHNLLITTWANHDTSLNGLLHTTVTPGLNIEQFVNTLNNLIESYERSANVLNAVIEQWERYPEEAEMIEEISRQPRPIIMNLTFYLEILGYVNPDTGLQDADLHDAITTLVDIGVIELRYPTELIEYGINRLTNLMLLLALTPSIIHLIYFYW